MQRALLENAYKRYILKVVLHLTAAFRTGRVYGLQRSELSPSFDALQYIRVVMHGCLHRNPVDQSVLQASRFL